jgi:hypothetical protein
MKLIGDYAAGKSDNHERRVLVINHRVIFCRLI